MSNRLNKRKCFETEAAEAIDHTANMIASIKPLLSVDYVKKKLDGRTYLMANLESLLTDSREMAPHLMTPDIKKKRVAAELCRKSVMQTLEKKKEIQLSGSPMSKQRQQAVKKILKASIEPEKSSKVKAEPNNVF